METLIEDSVLLQTLTEENQISGDDEIKELLKTLPIESEYIIRFYNSDLNFTGEEFLKLIKGLSYIDNKHLNNVLYYVKFVNNKDFRANDLDENLEKVYYSLKGIYTIDTRFNVISNFNVFIRLGCLPILKYIYRTTNIDIYSNENIAFINACTYGHLDIAKWLYELSNFTMNIHTKNCYAFKISCIKGHLNIAKWLYTIDGEKIIANFTYLDFCDVVDEENLNVTKWLYFTVLIKVNKFTASCANYYSFKNCCTLGHFEMLKWLFEMENPNLEIKEELFGILCQYGRIEMAKWLYENNRDINIDPQKEYAFRAACATGKIEMAKWLYWVSNGTIDISAADNYAFRKACIFGYLNIAQWIAGLPNFQKEILANKDLLRDCKYEVKEWLLSVV